MASWRFGTDKPVAGRRARARTRRALAALEVVVVAREHGHEASPRPEPAPSTITSRCLRAPLALDAQRAPLRQQVADLLGRREPRAEERRRRDRRGRRVEARRVGRLAAAQRAEVALAPAPRSRSTIASISASVGSRWPPWKIAAAPNLIIASTSPDERRSRSSSAPPPRRGRAVVGAVHDLREVELLLRALEHAPSAVPPETSR